MVITGMLIILTILAVVLISMLVAASSVSGYKGLAVVPAMVVMMLPPLLSPWLLGVGFRGSREAFPEPGPSILYGVLLGAGIACLLGCCFPRLWVIEITGKLIILTILAVVLISMLVAASSVSGYTGLAVVPVMVVMMLPPLLRLWILGVELSGRYIPRTGAAWNG